MKKVEICTTEWSLSILGKNKGIYGKIRLIGASESTRSRRIAINEFENNCRVPGDRYIQIETEPIGQSARKCIGVCRLLIACRNSGIIYQNSNRDASIRLSTRDNANTVSLLHRIDL